MPSIHEQNLINTQRAMENLLANMASDMPADEVLAKLRRDLETIDMDAYAAYSLEPWGSHPEVEDPTYTNAMVKAIVLQGCVQDCSDGKLTPAEALASISRRFEIGRARSARGDTTERDTATSSPTTQQGTIRRLESMRGDITSLRDRADRAISSGAFAYTADPTRGFMGLMKLKKDSTALLAYLDQMAGFVPSLPVYQAVEEELWFNAEVHHIIKEMKDLDPAVWRERPAPRQHLADQQGPYLAPAPPARRYNPYRPAAWQDVSDLKIFLGILLVTLVVPFLFISCMVALGSGG